MLRVYCQLQQKQVAQHHTEVKIRETHIHSAEITRGEKQGSICLSSFVSVARLQFKSHIMHNQSNYILHAITLENPNESWIRQNNIIQSYYEQKTHLLLWKLCIYTAWRTSWTSSEAGKGGDSHLTVTFPTSLGTLVISVSNPAW